MSTLKVDTITTISGTGNINLSRPIAGDGSNLTGISPTKATIEALGIDLPAANLTGTVADARFPATLPASSGVNLTALNASNISSGTLPAGRYTDTVYTHPTTAGNKHIPSGGATDQVLTYSSSGTASWADSGGGGKVLQTIWTNTSTVTSTNTAFGWDDTIPQRSEGTEILSQAFTPVSATSNILIQAKIGFGSSVNARAVGALFVSTSTNAFTMSYSAEGNTEMEHIYLQWYVASGSTSARTYSARVGTSGTSYYVRVNTGGTNAHRFSTANNSNMLITEYEAN